jgi:hypothetical protein
MSTRSSKRIAESESAVKENNSTESKTTKSNKVKSSKAENQKQKLFVVTRLHYRNNDTGHNSATVEGIFSSKEKAVAHLDKIYLQCLKEEYNGRPIETSHFNDSRRTISEVEEDEGDTDIFNIESHDLQ